MTNKPDFKQAKQKLTSEVEHGDIVVYQPAPNAPWKRGIVYNLIAHPQTKETIGFRLLPVETIWRDKEPSQSIYRTLVKTNGSIVENAGGTPRQHKTVVYFNFVSHRHADPIMGGPEGKTVVDAKPKENIWVLGSYNGSNYLAELIDSVALLYERGEMYKDGKKIEAGDPIRILNSRFARDKVLDNRHLRHRILANLSSSNEGTGSTPLGEIAKDQSVKKPKSKTSIARSGTQPVEAPAPVPAPLPVPPVFDVRLKDIFPVLNVGSEWSGVTKLRGGAHDNEENQPIVDPQTGKKTKVLGTLRDAWTYLKNVSEDLNADKIAKTLQQTGPISANGAAKTVGILQHLFVELNKIEEKDGELLTNDSDMQVLIDRGSVFTVKEP